ncbi:tRNA-dihydrouridine(16/17) synthase [NAD(P)(+)]-like protein [Schistosoma haematobium]|uniref:tRNA-dihydrouridine(16/17) synthase [NAD(P)(+)] n=1 Tax=Schistosoma haematobium TaxID=6185 RepID=A0A922S260_SCHHA|nr:tRNA-dihydrouridine(16/17) synthase [NAD(P)(+)]-like protein [Schistosoma haematobium]KAH9590524.1 tRNA-dihydrouridine(16/17) synthase [NAD(P)(+)]-like protein [Schistosoma haematobium]
MSLLDSWNSPKYVLAPMVDGSELAWRMLGRKYGVQLTFTPMINSTAFLINMKYRRSCLQFASEDRPLIVQVRMSEKNYYFRFKCAKLVQPFCDAVDLNLGCPQGIAKRGHYGAFLQDEWNSLKEIVSRASLELNVPVTCKIRIFSDVERTVQYAKLLEAAGASMLTVHGRTREMKGQKTGLADWNQIRAVKEAVKIPVIANGNIQYLSDVHQCLDSTKADAVMSAGFCLSKMLFISFSEMYFFKAIVH